MPLISDKNVKIFDTQSIKRGDAIRLKRTGDSEARNGLVIEVSEQAIKILYSNIQKNATSFLQIIAADVAVGVWEIYWTTDFQNINYENNAIVTPSLP